MNTTGNLSAREMSEIARLLRDALTQHVEAVEEKTKAEIRFEYARSGALEASTLPVAIREKVVTPKLTEHAVFLKAKAKEAQLRTAIASYRAIIEGHKSVQYREHAEAKLSLADERIASGQ